MKISDFLANETLAQTANGSNILDLSGCNEIDTYTVSDNIKAKLSTSTCYAEQNGKRVLIDKEQKRIIDQLNAKLDKSDASEAEKTIKDAQNKGIGIYSVIEFKGGGGTFHYLAGKAARELQCSLAELAGKTFKFDKLNVKNIIKSRIKPA